MKLVNMCPFFLLFFNISFWKLGFFLKKLKNTLLYKVLLNQPSTKRKYTALPTAPYSGSYSINREFWPKTSLFQKSIGSFHYKVEESV